jgi:hypothetical protein
VTSHGFGHCNRTAAVLNRLPAQVPVTVRSHASLFEQWRQRLERPVEMAPYVSDVGAVNPPGDSNATDGAATLALAARCHAQAMERLDDEVGWLQEQGIATVLCDAPAVPLLAARRAGIPGFLMTNFTWADIYAPYAHAQEGNRARRLVADLRRIYRQASATFRIEPALAMAWLSPKIDTGMVINRGRNRRAELRRRFGVSRAEKLVYLYVGRYGQSDLDWSRLERLARRGVHFLSHHAAPGGSPANLHVVPSAGWSGADLIASSDTVVAKAGYGTACQVMASGTPMVYPPRRGFAEYRSLDRALRRWGGGIPISWSDFSALALERSLTRAFEIEPGPPPFSTDGAERVAAHLARHCRAPFRATGSSGGA